VNWPKWPVGILLGALLSACGTDPVPHSPLPPSASDFTLLKSAKLCESRATILGRRPAASFVRDAWGSGEEARLPAAQAESAGDESYFFDENGLLVGALFAFPTGKDLGPYPVLRQTLGQLKPVMEFYLSGSQVTGRPNLDATVLYETGDEKTTTRYLVMGWGETATLMMASFAIDPYAKLLNPYRKEFLGRLKSREKTATGSKADGQGSEDKEPFLPQQQFARGETAQLGYCGSRDPDVAVDAYKKALALGFNSKVMLAEAHHKYGLALDAKGLLEPAKKEILASLAARPNVPEVINNLGDVYKKLGDRENAIKAFEKAVVLRPNYPLARFNLAGMYETVNPKLAISEYETYLALVEGVEEEAPRIAQAKARVKALHR
jgi:tetratricopeptide (TPR) repeat protein